VTASAEGLTVTFAFHDATVVKVRFQADADLNHLILLAVVRREPAIDFRSAIAARS
jgi:hypothetical protein